MSFEILFVIGLVLVSVTLFATEKFPVDLVGLMVMGVLLLSGIITPEEGLSGFSNTATVTVAAMFVLSAGLYKTGAVNSVGRALARVGRWSFWLGLLVIMITIGAISAFINNTAAVAVFLPIIISMARETGVSASKLLMPLSFASMFGGVCTLIGTSTNILVSSIAERHGEPAFGLFEFSSLGILFFIIGIIYMMTIGVRLIPGRRAGVELTETFEMKEYLTEIVLTPEAASVGKKVIDSPLVKELDIGIVNLFRDGVSHGPPSPHTVLQANDELRVRCSIEKIKRLQQRIGVLLKPQRHLKDKDLQMDDIMLVEAVVAPNSFLVGKSLKETAFRKRFNAIALAMRHRDKLLHEKLGTTRLSAGDVLLIELEKGELEKLKQSNAFVIVSEVGEPGMRRRKVIPALLIVAGVVATAAAGMFPIVVSAIIGTVLMVALRCITLEEAYQAIEWKVIFLLAGVLTLGIALEKTGTAAVLSHLLVNTVGVWGPVAVVSALYLLTSLLTEAMSNNATAALLAPIAIATAESLGVDSRPLLMAVTFAASSSFMTPVGYQTNTMIYGAGQYKFADFLRVGTPLNIIFWIVATIMIPLFWEF